MTRDSVRAAWVACLLAGAPALAEDDADEAAGFLAALLGFANIEPVEIVDTNVGTGAYSDADASTSTDEDGNAEADTRIEQGTDLSGVAPEDLAAGGGDATLSGVNNGSDENVIVNDAAGEFHNQASALAVAFGDEGGALGASASTAQMTSISALGDVRAPSAMDMSGVGGASATIDNSFNNNGPWTVTLVNQSSGVGTNQANAVSLVFGSGSATASAGAFQ